MDANAIVGLAGVALGWVLGFVATFLRERVEARRAIALVLAELGFNGSALESATSGDLLERMEPARHDVWDRLNLIVQRLLNRDQLAEVISAYAALDTLTHYVDQLKSEKNELMNAMGGAILGGTITKEDQQMLFQIKSSRLKEVGEALDGLAQSIPRSYQPPVTQGIEVLKSFRPLEAPWWRPSR